MDLIQSEGKEIVSSTKKLNLLERVNKISFEIKNRKKLTYSEFENAVYHFDKKEYQEAKELLLKVLEKEKDNLEARYMLGQCFMLLQEFKDGLKQFKYVLKKEPDEEYALFQKALAYLELKKYKESERDFLRYLDLGYRGCLKETYLFMGEVYFETDEWELAIEYVKKSRRFDYKSEEGHYVISCSYLNLGNYKTGIKWLKEGLKLYPEYEALKNLEKELIEDGEL